MTARATAILFAVAVAGCYATTDVGYQAGYVGPAPVYTAPPAASVEVDTYGPDLVDVGGGVQVIADYDEPVFYTDRYYWRFYGGTWYRSNSYNGGWVVYNDVPYSVRRIDRPHAYVHYRPQGYVPRSQRVYGGNRDPYVRDHRQAPYQGSPAPVRDHRQAPYQGSPAPIVRDHRDAPYQGSPAPIVRDHRDNAPPPPRERRDRDDRRAPPIVREHP